MKMRMSQCQDVDPGTANRMVRKRIAIRGAVQGVGFRPYTYGLAHDCGVAGWVRNSPAGVEIEAEGADGQVTVFLARLQHELPPLATVDELVVEPAEPTGERHFGILASVTAGGASTAILPDMATCPACLDEIRDPGQRRYRYPFTNCTHCGPRFSIIRALPYDRHNTTMVGFAMCARCRAEYDNPADRRFHAQPVACPDCGPQLAFWDAAGRPAAMRDSAIHRALSALRDGQIVAVKGIGGFHLMVDARDETAVGRLRDRKHRSEKPFALMYPGLPAIKADCRIEPAEADLLLSPAAPIVLLDRMPGRQNGLACDAVAPHMGTLGVMLPYTPLHHILLTDFAAPVVATSGNVSDEPICYDEQEARVRLRGIADCFLVHDRPIARPMDDSIARVIAGAETTLRRGRGYAPAPVAIHNASRPVIATGGHLKNTIAVAKGTSVYLSQHIGDLDNSHAVDAFHRALNDLPRLYESAPACVACDLHPDYTSTRHAAACGLPVVPVQHHYAHVLSCMAENALEGPVLGVAWDGTGYGPDGTIWGGEFLECTYAGYTRTASLYPFPLPGGDKAIREPRRSALGMLRVIFSKDGATRHLRARFESDELRFLNDMITRKVRTPLTSSAGRLFDGVAALIGVRQRVSYEGQAAMELEAIARAGTPGPCRYSIDLAPANECIQLDWRAMVRAIVSDVQRGTPPPDIARAFHSALAESILKVAHVAKVRDVAVTGGCFQNRLLAEMTIRRLEQNGFRVHRHRHVPPGDGGIALGQAVFAAHTQNQD